MGIDIDTAQFLFGCRSARVSFSKTLTLGRQNFYPEAKSLQKTFDLLHIGASASQLIAGSDGYADNFFKLLGSEETVAVDRSDYEGASLLADLNAPTNQTLKNRFSVVFDGGCLEHIFNFPQAIKNCMEMLTVGGHFVGVSPANNFCGHGFYQFSPELFFRVFSGENGFLTRAVLIKEGKRWYRVSEPSEVGQRVELMNSRPTLLFVLAKKIAGVDLLSKAPQQSDYVQRWQEQHGSAELVSTSRVRSVYQVLGALLPQRWKNCLRPFSANLPIRFRSQDYRQIDEQHLLRGNFNVD